MLGEWYAKKSEASGAQLNDQPTTSDTNDSTLAAVGAVSSPRSASFPPAPAQPAKMIIAMEIGIQAKRSKTCEAQRRSVERWTDMKHAQAREGDEQGAESDDDDLRRQSGESGDDARRH